ncbi:MAG: site-specific integrase [Clostridia bacterium]|nr:site-specific integrase [Clostridia bacterium]
MNISSFWLGTKEKNFKKIAEEWLLLKRYIIKDSSYYRYKNTIENHFKSLFEIKASKLKKVDYNCFAEKLICEYNPKTAKDIIIILKSILKYADQKYGTKINTEMIVSPRTSFSKLLILDKSSQTSLSLYCMNSSEPRDIGVLMSLYTGMRIGEICALKWEDIHVDECYIEISKTMERISMGNGKSYVYIGDAKTYSSVRNVPINQKLKGVLECMQSKLNPNGNEFFLTGEENRFVEPRNLQYWFKRRLKLLNISENKFHILRHTFATNCIRLGMDAKSLSEILGHSNVTITLDKYVHSSYDTKMEYLEKM